VVVQVWHIQGNKVNDQSQTTQSNSRSISRNFISAVIVGCAVVGAGAAWTLTQTQTPVAVATPQVVVAANATATASMQTVALPLMTGLPDFTPLVEAVGPSVVNIRTLENAKPQSSGGSDEQMLEFFRRFGIPVPPGFGGNPDGDAPKDGEQRPRGIGSGFVLSADGYIMTNAHVVDGADELIVTMPDKREFKAKIIGADKRTDVAVVKVDATDLVPVRLGDPEMLKVGAWVMAIGSPYGLENTVTAGIVSAKARETGDFLPFIQTDVAINPGNSGGPLINMRGEVVGINSQIYSRSGGFQGISFAIPIDEAVRVSTQLRSQGFVTRGRIGVSIASVDKETAEALGLGKPRGALVNGVEAGSPAAKAGLEPGDVIIEFEGVAIEKSLDLPRVVGNTKPGTTSPLTVVRQGKEKKLTITVGAFDPEPMTTAEVVPEPQTGEQLLALGLSVLELTPQEMRELKIEGGVKVKDAQGAAARAGMRPDDVILAVANTKVADVNALKLLLAKTADKPVVSILFRRGQWVQYALLRR
jgi:serine protease Do